MKKVLLAIIAAIFSASMVFAAEALKPENTVSANDKAVKTDAKEYTKKRR